MIQYFRQFHQDERGFTLIEMLVVLFIIGLLLLMVIPNITKHRDSSQSRGDRALQSTLQTQVDLYTYDNDGGQATFELLNSGDYLNDDQYQRAQEKFTIDNNTVRQK